MPFIRGKYHINPVLGEALEAAREAEAALETFERDEEKNGSDKDGEKAPVHRVEIEAAEMAPSHSGRAQRGYVALVHREANRQETGGTDDLQSGNAGGAELRDLRGRAGRESAGSPAETHVFANHEDLVNFLREELGRDEGE